MNTNIEFLDDEPIENLITCIHYKIDKLIFFGFSNIDEKQKSNIDAFATKYCGVKQIEYVELTKNDISQIVRKLRDRVSEEINAGNDVYFDITGGNSQVLLAFGMIANELKRPIHMYDIETDKLIEYEDVSVSKISDEVEENKFHLNLETYIIMHGGLLYEPGCEDSRYLSTAEPAIDEEFLQDINHIWDIQKRYPDYWNAFSEFMRKNMIPDSHLEVRAKKDRISKLLAESTSKFSSARLLEEMLEALSSAGIIKEYNSYGDSYSYWFKSAELKECIWKSGSILEYIVYQDERKHSEECRVSVNLDWDGKLKNDSDNENNVYNEVDVLTLNGNIPTFISCKSGNVDPKAFYELDTIAKRLGGKYAKKKIVTVQHLSRDYRDRAIEMGIEPVQFRD